MAQVVFDVASLQAEFTRERRNRPRLARKAFKQFFPDRHCLVTSLPHFLAALDVLPDMKQDLAHVLQASAAHATVMVGDVRWNVYVFGVSRVGPDMFVQLALIGPRNCTITVRARAPLGNRATARRVLAVVRQWIISEDPSDQAYLELSDLNEMAS